jgi:acyl dehydratase
MATTTFTAIADPPEVQKANPIHGDAGAKFGYDGAIVAGISTYGWAAQAIIAELGEGWLNNGWSETFYRAGVYVDDKLTSSVEPDGDGAWTIDQTNEADTSTVTGTCGLGRASWSQDFDLPNRRSAEPAVDRPPRLDPTAVPTYEDYPPMEIDVTRELAIDWATTRLADPDPRYVTGDNPALHPSWVPGQMTPLIRHSYRFGIGVHAIGRVQHLAPIQAGQKVVVAGRWTEAWQKKDRQWSTTDAVFTSEDGTDLAYCRQTVVFLA